MRGRRSDARYRATAGAKPRQGSSSFRFVAGRKIDARAGKPRDEYPELREPANQSLITDVLSLRPYRCMIVQLPSSTVQPSGGAAACAEHLTMDITADCGNGLDARRVRSRIPLAPSGLQTLARRGLVLFVDRQDVD